MFKKRKDEELIEDTLDEFHDMDSIDSYFNIDEPQGAQQPSAPLFIKLDKYNVILQKLQDITSFIMTVKQLFTVLHETETLRNDVMNLTRVSVQKLEKNITEIDAELLRPKGVDVGMEHANMEVKYIEHSLTELQNQLALLRKELESVR